MKRCLWAAVVVFGWMAAVRAEPGDSRILAARDAIRSGDRVRLAQLAEPAGHVLDPYAEYWFLINRLARPEDTDYTQVRDFLQRQQGSYLAEKLRADWIRQTGKRGEWSVVLAEYPRLEQPEQDSTCYYIQARLRSGDQTALDTARPLWLTLLDVSDACQPVLQALAEDGRTSVDDVWWRFRRMIEAKRPGAARATAAWLPVDQQPAPGAIESLMSSPTAWLDRQPVNFSSTRPGRELALAALARLSREDPLAALVHFNRIDERFSAVERSYAYSQIASQGAQKLLPEANAWYKAAGDVPLTEDQRGWQVRAALRAGDWRSVRRAIEAMPPAQRELPEWGYWLGRALTTLGQREAARREFERVAGHPTFYGILAGEELGHTFELPPKPAALSTDEQLRVERNPGLQRALALFRLDMRTEGVREWNWSLRNQDDRFLIGAAQLASQHAIYDRAIMAADRTRTEHDFSLRYLAPYKERIEPNARSRGLDMGWVYGLMRQESRFISSARSGVGAQGLMQIMPDTGRLVAKKLGMKGYSVGWLHDPDTNVMLGTTYMSMVLSGLDNHPVLASAAYNAGPGRAKKWKDVKPLEGAIYAETIPFSETRDYVKKVMANSVVYAALFEGRAPSLKARLGTISPRSGSDVAGSADPGAGLDLSPPK